MAKGKVKKIQDHDSVYSFLYHYVGFLIRLSYRKIVHVGKENIPTDGAIILAPNHTNTLMDALVVLDYDRKPKVFVARADIFKNRKLAKILTFLKIMPIMRQRDGFNAVKKNQEIIDKAVDVLKDKMQFCIFPEGTHLAKFSSLPLSKGIFRIAFQAHEQMGDFPLYIIPVGIRYGNHFRYRSTLRMEFGQAINVGEFIKANSQLTQQEQINCMRDMLTERLHNTIFHIPNDENYNAIFEICNAAEPVEITKILKADRKKRKNSVGLQYEANNNTIKRFETIKENDPAKAERLIELGNKACTLRQKLGIDIESASAKKPVVSRMKKIVLTLLTLPYAIPALIAAAPVTLLCNYIFTMLKDPAFRNSVRYLMNLLVWPVVLIIYAIIAFVLLPWQWALIATILTIPSPIVAHEVWKSGRLVISDIKLLNSPTLKNIYTQIRELIEE